MKVPGARVTSFQHLAPVPLLTGVCVSMSVCIVCVCLWVCVSECMCVFVSVCVWVCLGVFVCECVCECVCEICVWECVSCYWVNFLFVYLNLSLIPGPLNWQWVSILLTRLCVWRLCVYVCVSIEGYSVLVFVNLTSCPSQLIVLMCVLIYFILCRPDYTCLSLSVWIYFGECIIWYVVCVCVYYLLPMSM